MILTKQGDNPKNILISQKHKLLGSRLTNVTGCTGWRFAFLLFRFAFFCLLFWIIGLNMSGITIILFSESHLTAFWDSAISISTSYVTNFSNADNVLSSAKLCTAAFLMQQQQKKFKNALNSIGPTIEPCRSPEIMSLKSLFKFSKISMTLILVS